MVRLLYTIILLGMVLLWMPTIIYADGMITIPIVVAEGAKPSQSTQQAAVIWDNGVETLHLQSNYNGPAEDLCWVIPIPSRPKVERSSWRLFQEAEEATRPQLIGFQRGLGLGCGCGKAFDTRTSIPIEMEVTKLESLKIRELHVDILSAKDGGGLVHWLHTNGYSIPNKAELILQEYIARSFFFIAVKIQKGSLWTFLKGVRQTVTTGLTPLAITFKTDRPFYPLKISRVTSAPENELLLLMISTHQLQPIQYRSEALTGADIEKVFIPEFFKDEEPGKRNFAPAVKEAQSRIGEKSLIIEAAINMPLNAIQTDKLMWITRFHAFLTPDDMEDITFVPAENDEPLPRTFYIYDRVYRAAYPPMSFMVVGVVLMVISRGSSQRSRLRQMAMAFFLCALCLM